MKKVSKQILAALGILSLAMVIAFNGNISAKATPKDNSVTLSLLASSEALGEDCNCATGTGGQCWRITVNGNQTCECKSASSSNHDCPYPH